MPRVRFVRPLKPGTSNSESVVVAGLLFLRAHAFRHYIGRWCASADVRRAAQRQAAKAKAKEKDGQRAKQVLVSISIA